MHSCVAKRKEWTATLHIESLYLLVTRNLSCVMYPQSSNTSLKLLARPNYFLTCSMLSKQAIFGLVYIKTSLHPPCLNQTGHFSGSDQITSIFPPNMPPASSFSCPTASPLCWEIRWQVVSKAQLLLILKFMLALSFPISFALESGGGCR